MLTSIHRAVVTIEPWGILLAVFALFVSIIQFWMDYEERIREREVRAWQVVTTVIPGNSGKIDALEYLNSEDGLFCSEWLRGRLAWVWNKRKKSKCIILLKPQTRLDYLDLSMPSSGIGIYLEEIDLSNARLENSNLSNANMNDATLIEVDMEEANLRNSDFSNADLSDADLEGADMIRTVLHRTTLVGADMHRAKLINADLYKAELINADLENAELINADLTKANLTNADLEEASLMNANLDDADLTDAKLKNANLTRAILKHAEFMRTDLKGADLRCARLDDADLSNSLNLIQDQVNVICRDRDTKLPEGLRVVPSSSLCAC